MYSVVRGVVCTDFGSSQTVGREECAMANVLDVAAYILEKRGPMTAMKLQKLCYYSQAWHLVWDEQPLFRDRIEAWANGPVVPELYRQHRGEFHVSRMPGGHSDNLTESEKESIEVVLESYAELTAHQLSELTHSEDPWRDARNGISDGERSNKEIAHASIAEFYDAQTTAL